MDSEIGLIRESLRKIPYKMILEQKLNKEVLDALENTTDTGKSPGIKSTALFPVEDEIKRKGKPMERSARVRPTDQKVVFERTKQTHYDPRFSDLSGPLSINKFALSYGFIKDQKVKENEEAVRVLKNKRKTKHLSSDQIESLKNRVANNRQNLRAITKIEEEAEARRELRKELDASGRTHSKIFKRSLIRIT